jgi:hypothetical protein
MARVCGGALAEMRMNAGVRGWCDKNDALEKRGFEAVPPAFLRRVSHPWMRNGERLYWVGGVPGGAGMEKAWSVRVLSPTPSLPLPLFPEGP